MADRRGHRTEEERNLRHLPFFFVFLWVDTATHGSAAGSSFSNSLAVIPLIDDHIDSPCFTLNFFEASGFPSTWASEINWAKKNQRREQKQWRMVKEKSSTTPWCPNTNYFSYFMQTDDSETRKNSKHCDNTVHSEIYFPNFVWF